MSGLAGTEGGYHPVEEVVVLEAIQSTEVRWIGIMVSAPKGLQDLAQGFNPGLAS
jgi:hypothetical protein